MEESTQLTPGAAPTPLVPAGQDRFGEYRGLGVSSIQFKVLPQESNGLFVVENSFHAKGGPARHLHYDQDEWFYSIEGEFILEVGKEQFRLRPGDSLLAPRKVPHVWAYVGNSTEGTAGETLGATRGRILIAFMPAGKMEAFFREVTKANAMPPPQGS